MHQMGLGYTYELQCQYFNTYAHVHVCAHSLSHTHIYYIKPIMISTTITLSPCSFFFQDKILSSQLEAYTIVIQSHCSYLEDTAEFIAPIFYHGTVPFDWCLYHHWFILSFGKPLLYFNFFYEFPHLSVNFPVFLPCFFPFLPSILPDSFRQGLSLSSPDWHLCHENLVSVSSVQDQLSFSLTKSIPLDPFCMSTTMSLSISCWTLREFPFGTLYVELLRN